MSSERASHNGEASFLRFLRDVICPLNGRSAPLSEEDQRALDQINDRLAELSRAPRSESKDSEPSEEVIEGMADCLLKTFNTVTREEIIAAWRVATGFAGAATRATDRKPETFASGQQPTNSALSASASSSDLLRELASRFAAGQIRPQDTLQMEPFTHAELSAIQGALLAACAPRSSSAALTGWLRENAPDCGDNSCVFGGQGKGGMRANGGCRCFKDLPTMKRIYVERLFRALSEAPVSARRCIAIDDNLIANAREAQKVGMTRVTMSVPVEEILGPSTDRRAEKP